MGYYYDIFVRLVKPGRFYFRGEAAAPRIAPG